MQVHSYKSYAEDTPVRVSFPKAASRLLGSLGLSLRFFSAQEPDILVRVVPALLDRIRDLVGRECSVANPLLFDQFIETHPCARDHRDLFDAYYGLQRDLLGLAEEAWIGSETLEVSKGAFFRTLYLPQYLQLKALIDVMGRPRGIQAMKRCLDWAYSQGPAHPDAPKTIDELRTRQVEGNLRGQGMDWIAGIVSEHQYQNKVTVCAIQKALAEYEDDELMEVVACYPDFTMFRNVNPNFCLTRTKTLVNGGEYCDMCYHDERYVPDFVHPASDVFDAMGAG